MQRFERCEWVESKPGTTVERIYRLTESGRLLALGGIDPETRWTRPWDRHWRLVTFDLPEKHNASRVRLRRYLRDRRFGFLQKSLWISPDSLDEDVKGLSALGEDVEAFLTWEARPSSGESDASIVNGAWNFNQLRQFHEKCLRLLQSPPARESARKARETVILDWAAKERAAWQVALDHDPLLPAPLLPPTYLGRDVWKLRNTVLRDAAQWLG